MGRQWLKEAGGHEAVAVADAAQVDHGAVVRHLHGLADAGLATFHNAQLVSRVVHTQRGHFVPGEPLPAEPDRPE